MRPKLSPIPVLLLLLAALGLGAAPAAATIFIVDCEADFPFDFTTISAAVTAAGTNDTIVVRPCSYNETVDIPATKNGLHVLAAEVEDTGLLGAGPSGVGATWSSPRPIVSGVSSYCMSVDAQDVSIQGLYLINCDGAGLIATNNADRLRVHDTVISSFDGVGVRVDGAESPSLTSLWIYQVADYGIRLQGVNRAFVADSSIQGIFGFGGTGIWIGGGSVRSQILRNEIYGSWGPGIHDRNAMRSRIERNTALGNCTGMLSPSCDCNQILVAGPSVNADVAGNDVGATGISLCATSAEAAENND